MLKITILLFSIIAAIACIVLFFDYLIDKLTKKLNVINHNMRMIKIKEDQERERLLNTM